MLLASTLSFGNTGQQHSTDNSHNAYAQTPSSTTTTIARTENPAARNATANGTSSHIAATTSSTGTENATASKTNMSATTAARLGKLIFRETGHVIVNRVLDVTDNSVTIESSYTGNGVVNGTTSVLDIGTVTYTVDSTGQVTGKGQGLLRTSDGSSIAAYSQKYTATEDIQGNTNVQGTVHFSSLATGKLADLSNTNNVFKAQITPSGSSTLQAWEQQK
jgi:hypothetical protein